MATRFLARSLLTSKPPLSSALSHSCASVSAVLPNSSSFLFRLRPIVAAASASYFRRLLPSISTRAFSTRQTASSLNDPNPNWSNRPPKETILLDGCDFEHWLVVVEKPEGDPTRDEIIDSYIKTLAMVVGSEEEARMKIYSVSTRHYFAFGALVSEELSYKLKELPKVRWVLPDSYLDVKNKDYGGEPFINGQAVPYDPKYHEEWVRNNARANERNRRNDRPRNFDRSRNFERRRELQGPNPGGPGGNFNGGPPPANPSPNMGGQLNNGGGGPVPNNTGNYQRPLPNNPSNFQQGPGPNSGGPPYQPGPGPNHGGGFPAGGPGPSPGGFPSGQNQNPYANAGGGSPYQNQNYPGPNSGNFGSNPGYGPGPSQHNFAPNPGSGPGQYQNAYGPNAGNPSQGQNIPGRDFPPSSNH
ncbi:hypothetical protein SASPL_152481 [Salvia splendens]|uniref:MORF/ORRM1/DAG-like MORF domain-containing protein n=1 Tax=Salvia splendens TaxID=180675 RepID=A0A8X8W3P6_SALSN|nr:multiple organellar RNA editing factor 8, chloroplastic/mitochondrial-like [Salvia splendens]KAG6387294.1 hypothetical protein SASPL_152481 [Salvia splendens]